jgi:hypothetical protein
MRPFYLFFFSFFIFLFSLRLFCGAFLLSFSPLLFSFMTPSLPPFTAERLCSDALCDALSLMNKHSPPFKNKRLVQRVIANSNHPQLSFLKEMGAAGSGENYPIYDIRNEESRWQINFPGEPPVRDQPQLNLDEPPVEPQEEDDSDPFEEEKPERIFSGFFAPQAGQVKFSPPSLTF